MVMMTLEEDDNNDTNLQTYSEHKDLVVRSVDAPDLFHNPSTKFWKNSENW